MAPRKRESAWWCRVGNADGRGRSGIIHAVRQADHVGLGIKMIRQIAADPLNPDTPDTVGRQHPLGGLRTGQPADGVDLRILLKRGIDG